MKRRIFRAIWVVAIVVFLASFLFILGIGYSYFKDVQFRHLRDQSKLVKEGVILGGQGYIDSLDPINYRITWIQRD
ncbi:MAG: PAS domain-containing sensor histidine kinase, partial [Clostridiales bacterium]|nr:PAS domain-containing sensor histidine kinase [Clostridiales bacterium]